MIIYYIVEKAIIKEDDKINNIINNINSYYILSNDCKYFFLNEGKELTIDKIMHIYSYFEHICYKDLILNLQEEYKKEIDLNIKNDIMNKFMNNKDIFIIFSKKDLGAAIRKFISRYLVGKMQINDLKEDRNLVFELTREDLWEEKINKKENLGEIIEKNISQFNLNISQAFSFYELIGDEDKKEFQDFYC